MEYSPVHDPQLWADDPYEVVEVAKDVDAEECGGDSQDVPVELVVGQDAGVTEAVDVALDLRVEVGHAPAPVDEEEADGEDDLQAGAGQVAPVADVGEPEALHDLVQVLHVLPRQCVHVLSPERLLHQQLVKLLDLVPSSKGSATKLEND